jgi:hypothetical protein
MEKSGAFGNTPMVAEIENRIVRLVWMKNETNK